MWSGRMETERVERDIWKNLTLASPLRPPPLPPPHIHTHTHTHTNTDPSPSSDPTFTFNESGHDRQPEVTVLGVQTLAVDSHSGTGWPPAFNVITSSVFNVTATVLLPPPSPKIGKLGSTLWVNFQPRRTCCTCFRICPRPARHRVLSVVCVDNLWLFVKDAVCVCVGGGGTVLALALIILFQQRFNKR